MSEKKIMPGGIEKPTDSTTEIIETRYDINGNLTETIKRAATGSLITRSTFARDGSGRLAEVLVFNADGSLSPKKVYEYKDGGEERITEEYVYTSADTLISKAITAHDAYGKPIEFAAFDAGGKPQMRQVISYAPTGKVTEIRYFEGQNIQIGKTVFAYDTRGGLVSEEIFGPDGSQSSRITFKGDTLQGTNLTIEEFDSTGRLISKEKSARDIDLHGNWVKQTKTKLNPETSQIETIEITSRTISYYK